LAPRPGADRPIGLAARDVLAFLLLGIAGLALPALGALHARAAVVNFGPNDADYVRGFREDWERDRATRFHWTTNQASVRVPLRIAGTGARLSMRIRRHLIEPAKVTIRIEGRIVSTFDIQADPQVAYRVLSIDLPPLEGGAPFVLTVDSTSADPRPLGIALDWMEVARTGGTRFLLLTETRLALLAIVIVAFLAPRLASARLEIAVLHATAIVLAATIGAWWDVLAAERIVRDGALVYLLVAVAAVLLARVPRLRLALSLPSLEVGGALVVLVLSALAIRLVILLHPQFYYPDVRVHALFAWQLARRGLVGFLSHFTENQYRYSLGLQMEHGHWYAFPYPPAFYVLCWPLVSLARMRPEVAVSVLAAAVNSLEAFLVFAVARRLRARTGTALAAAAGLVVLPLFLARLSLAYFPAMVGHAVDVVVILFLIASLGRLERPRMVATLGALIALALLTYTQSLLNFAVLLPLVAITWLASDPSREARRRVAGMILAGALGGVLSLAAFYGRYVPIFFDMQRGIPMPEERILSEKPSTPVPEEELAPQEPDDPYAGPTLDLGRGLRKAAWRLYVFYGAFAPLVILGVVLVCRQQPSAERAFVTAWALSYVVLNLLSGGLPGPNLVRYNKDLEVVAPLCCLALATIGEWLWLRWRWAAVAYGTTFGAFGIARAVRYLTEKFILER
jgi:hypothetical protein